MCAQLLCNICVVLSNYILLRLHSGDVRLKSSLMKICSYVVFLYLFFSAAHNLRHEEDKRGSVQEK